jgi:N-acetylglutamate synthase-like GNAT family acetyltransferase
VSITLRDATPADWPTIASLLRVNHLPTEGFRESVSAAVVAGDGDDVVGIAGLEIYDDAALLRSVVVRETARGRGLGQQLTRAAMDLAGARHLAQVYLLTTTAQAFFARLGFEIIERSSVPETVQQSVEFKGACPASAIAMRRPVGSPEQA